MIVDNGKKMIANLLIGSSTLGKLDANCKIAVGSSNKAVVAADQGLVSWLSGQPMTSGYPRVGAFANNTMVVSYRATFGPDEANGNWQEWGLVTNTNPNTLFNREVVNNGTKTKGQTWIMNIEITYTRG